jgi:protein-S-isoprenylcysteine O-methyltransferase Ste14
MIAHVLKSGIINKDDYSLWINMGHIGERARHFFEALFAAVLFGTQTILNAGIFMGIMTIPLLPYFWLLLSDANFAKALGFNVYMMLFAKEFWVGRIIALIGVTVFLLAAGQLLRSRRKGEFINSGLYSRVRHPQFTGIIIIAVGLTVIVATNGSYYPLTMFQVISLWLLQVLGYVAIARYEEWRLLKKLGDSYRQYRQKVPFLFPIKCPSRIPETLFTTLSAMMIWAVLLYLPYNLFRIV